MRLIITIFTMFLFTQLNAQPSSQDTRRGDFEKFRAQKVSFITNALSLTPAEAEKFWPIYNEYDRKRAEFHRKRADTERRLMEGIEKGNNLSNNELTEINNTMLNNVRIEYELLKEYNEKFKAVLPIKKVVMLNIVEKNFSFRMLRDYRGDGDRNRDGDRDSRDGDRRRSN